MKFYYKVKSPLDMNVLLSAEVVEILLTVLNRRINVPYLQQTSLLCLLILTLPSYLNWDDTAKIYTKGNNCAMLLTITLMTDLPPIFNLVV